MAPEDEQKMARIICTLICSAADPDSAFFFASEIDESQLRQIERMSFGEKLIAAQNAIATLQGTVPNTVVDVATDHQGRSPVVPLHIAPHA